MKELDQILEVFRAKIGKECVDVQENALKASQENITEYQGRKISGVLKPKHVQDVQALVKVANENQFALHPFSSGKNWGLGSKIPTADHVGLLDLSALNQIRYLDQKYKYVIIEAGVTQKQLSDYLRLHAPDFMLPMTGSGNDTSVVGNLLQRGVTFFGHRNELLCGVEAIIGEGEMVRTGHWHYAKGGAVRENFCQPAGLGPDLTGLFTQSNLGIVTAVAVRLQKIKKTKTFYFDISEEHLPKVIKKLESLFEQGIIRPGILITNKNDPRTTENAAYSYSGQWFIAFHTSANKHLLAGIEKVIHKSFGAYINGLLGCFRSDESLKDTHPYFQVLQQMSQGIPTNYSLETMAALRKSYKEGGIQDAGFEIDQYKDMPGFSVVLLAVPFEGSIVKKIVKKARKIAAQIGVEVFLNFCTMSRFSMEGYFRVYFDRNDPEEIKKAHEWNAKTYQAFREMGVYPYRINVNEMPNFIDERSTFWQTVEKIKMELDPKGIIAPNYYNLS